MPQLFDPLKFTPEQMQSLQNIPGQSLAATNTPALIQSVQDNPNVITPSNLTSTQQYGIVDPTKSVIPDVSTLQDTTQPALTPQEQLISAQTQEIQGQNTALAQKPVYQAEQNTLAGVDTQQQALADLGHQLTALQNEAKAIPLQLQNNSAGITTGVLQTMTDAALRTNAIKALTVSTLIDATNGFLDSAQKKADQAVALKYGVLEAQNKADIANLELIKNSPETSLQDRNRATQQQNLKDQQATLIAQQKTDAENIYKTAISAAQNSSNFTPTQDYQTVTQALSAINNARTPMDAIMIASETGMLKSPDGNKTQVVKLDNGNTVLLDMSTGEIVKNLGGSGGGGSGGGSGSGSGGGLGGGSGKVSSTTQAIIDNPSLFNDLTPTVRGTVISELQANGYDTSNLGTKGLSDTAIKEVAQTQKALEDLSVLRTKLAENTQFLGPISGLQKFNPWSKAKQVQADVDRVRQTVGKALEGGVLRKEDEEKYKQILATLLDTPETATYKIDALVSSIQRDIENYKNLQQAGGASLDVKASLQKQGSAKPLTSAEARSKFNY